MVDFLSDNNRPHDWLFVGIHLNAELVRFAHWYLQGIAGRVAGVDEKMVTCQAAMQVTR